MQECLVCEALFREELLLSVRGCDVLVVVLALVLVGFLISPVFLVVLGRVFDSFVLREVHGEVCGRSCVCKMTCGEELRTGGLALFVRVVGRLAAFLLADKALLLPAWQESTSAVIAIEALAASVACLVSPETTAETTSASKSSSGSSSEFPSISSITIVAVV